MKKYSRSYVLMAVFTLATLVSGGFFLTGYVSAEQVVLASPPETPKHPPLRIFAASSLVDVVNRLEKIYELREGVKIKSNFASTSTLARQLDSGAEADLFLSASTEWTEFLRGKKLLGKRARFARNRLALVSPVRLSSFEVEFTPEFALGAHFTGRLVLGDPSHVPAGEYARSAFIRLAWWKHLEARILPASSAREALLLVERGEVDLGVVYATDARSSDAVKVIGLFPEELHKPINYTGALLRGASPDAEVFLRFLTSPESRSILMTYGFSLPDTGDGTGDTP